MFGIFIVALFDMKKLLIITILIVFSSCNKGPNIEGTWYYSYNLNAEAPHRVTIQKDSITFHYSHINFLEKQALKIEKSQLLFKGFEIPFQIIGDTLIVGGNQEFYRNPVILDPYEMPLFDPKIDINLPSLHHEIAHNIEPGKDNVFFKFFGTNPGTNKNELLINDAFVDDFSDFLTSFAFDIHDDSTDLLFFDKNLKMYEIEKFFLAAKFMNQPKVIFVNDMQASYDKNLGILYNYYVLKKSFFIIFLREHLLQLLNRKTSVP